ncbi:MAG: pectate lyase [Prevotellaceae bacterium]|jgi:pectate lyase|nr:pectate lyase [Prevotellaceae bacterium]
MKNKAYLFIALCTLILLLPTATAYGQLPVAFPGADGFGKYTTGGRGGRVLIVDNLHDGGAGSLREAIQTKGARTIIFRVSGTVFLKSALIIDHDSLTIAGQTAPGDGICIAGYPVKIKADNVVIRYLRFRLGDIGNVQDDAISAARQHDIIIDHCSMSWSTDECASFYDNENFTLQWCILSESLRQSVHMKGAHGYGGIWGGKRASFHHNLLAHHSSRNPRFCGARYHEQTKETEIADFRNNVIYNWGFNSSYAGENGQYNIVNNYYKPGPATQKKVRSRILEAWQSKDGRGFHDFGRFYVAGNVIEGHDAVSANNWEGVNYKLYIEREGIDRDVTRSDSLYTRCRSAQPFEYIIDTQHGAQEAYEAVLQHAGASLVRDAIDRRIIDEVRKDAFTYGDKGMIDSQTQVGGWPELISQLAPFDSDNDGMPDAWEDARGLNKHNPADAIACTISTDYTNIEIYINDLIQ